MKTSHFKSALLACAFLIFNLSFASTGKPRVAIIGAGGAGVTTAWLLEKNYDVTLIEKTDHLGGHANTLDVRFPNDPRYRDQVFPIDAGFEFISPHEFPYFARLLNILKVPVDPFELTTTFFSDETRRSFVVTPIKNGPWAWSTLFSPTRLYRLWKLKGVFDKARTLVENTPDTNWRAISQTLKEFIDEMDLSEDTRDGFIYPILAAGWGVSREEIKTYSAYYLFATLLTETDGRSAPTWFEIRGGTRSYISAAITESPTAKILKNTSVETITHPGRTYRIVTRDLKSGEVKDFDFDSVVLATPLNQMRGLLANLQGYENLIQTANNVRYYETNLYLHGDDRFMPKNRTKWSVMNIRSIKDGEMSGMSVYKPNHSPAEHPVFKSWIFRDRGETPPKNIYGEAKYFHPHLDRYYLEAQKAVREVQGVDHLYFAGVHTQHTNRHESAIISAIQVAKSLAPNSARLRMLLQLDEPEQKASCWSCF